jgi:hypothetical protein
MADVQEAVRALCEQAPAGVLELQVGAAQALLNTKEPCCKPHTEQKSPTKRKERAGRALLTCLSCRSAASPGSSVRALLSCLLLRQGCASPRSARNGVEMAVTS